MTRPTSGTAMPGIGQIGQQGPRPPPVNYQMMLGITASATQLAIEQRSTSWELRRAASRGGTTGVAAAGIIVRWGTAVWPSAR